jgi:hypothetical protein
MRLTYYRKDDNSEAECVNVTTAKKLLKKQGGKAWTEHYDRDGSLFEVSKIEPNGNNSKFKYNHHL